MTLAMEKLQQMLPPEERLPSAQEPLLIVRELLRRIDFDGSLNETQKRRLTWCAHLGYGAACGVGYASLGRRLPVPAPARGALYGAFVWALSYGAWLPALRILPAPLCRPLGRNALLIAAHLIWGVSTSLIYERVTASGRAGR